MSRTTYRIIITSKKNDKIIIQHTLNLLNSSKTIDEYKTFLRYMAPNSSVIEKALSLPKLNNFERKIFDELLRSNYNEYLMKNDNQSCCYSTMNAFLVAAYCIIYTVIKFAQYTKQTP